MYPILPQTLDVTRNGDKPFEPLKPRYPHKLSTADKNAMMYNSRKLMEFGNMGSNEPKKESQ